MNTITIVTTYLFISLISSVLVHPVSRLMQKNPNSAFLVVSFILLMFVGLPWLILFRFAKIEPINFLEKFSCTLGFHSWSSWKTPYIGSSQLAPSLCTSQRSCYRCNKKAIKKEPHNWEKWKFNYVEGKMGRTCERCLGSEFRQPTAEEINSSLEEREKNRKALKARIDKKREEVTEILLQLKSSDLPSQGQATVTGDINYVLAQLEGWLGFDNKAIFSAPSETLRQLDWVKARDFSRACFLAGSRYENSPGNSRTIEDWLIVTRITSDTYEIRSDRYERLD